MKVIIGKGAEKKTWQADFALEMPCVHAGCQGTAELAFVAYEGIDNDNRHTPFLCDLKQTTGKPGGLWLHDCASVAVYFCRVCLRPTAECN